MKKLKIVVPTLLFSLSICILLNLGFSDVAQAQETKTLKVATYNVESPFPDEPPDETLPRVVSEHIAALAGPDLWGLSEVPDDQALTAYQKAAEYNGSDFQRILGTSGSNRDLLGILYNRNRLEQVGSTQQLREQVGGDRAPLASQFRSVSDGTKFWAVVNHFNRGSEEVRNRQAANLRNWIESQSLPVVALGDFNMDYSVDLSFNQPSGCDGDIEKGNEAFRIFTESNEINWIQPQCLENQTCPVSGTGCFRCYNSILDFVFVGGSSATGWTGTSEIAFQDDPDYCENDPLGDTDHRPVLATLSYPTGTTPQPEPEPSPGKEVDLKIVELFPNPVGGSEIESQEEAITIANTGNESVSLSGWTLRDAANRSWSLFGTIEPGQRIEFQRQGQEMALNNDGDVIQLVNASGDIVNEARYSFASEGEAVVISSN